MGKIEFETELKPAGPSGDSAYVDVPERAAGVFGSKARTSVRGTIDGFSFRSSIFPRGDGSFYMAVNKEMRAATGANRGDRVQLTLERDDTPRELDVPADLGDALGHDAAARSAWEAMSYSRRKEYVDWILEAKRDETRTRRVEKSVSMVAERKRLR